MLDALKTAKKVVGIKQLRRAVQQDSVAEVYVADDADPWIREEIDALCRQAQLRVIHVAAMKELGSACRIGVGAACAAILKQQNHGPNGSNPGIDTP